MRSTKRCQIGEIVDAYWDEKQRSVRFTILITQWNIRLRGSCPSGIDPVTGVFVPSSELKQKTKKFIGMKVYDESGDYSGNERPDYEKLKKIRFNISISNMNASISTSNTKRGLNTYLKHILG